VAVEAGIEVGSVGRLQNAGILTDSGAFTCPAANIMFYYSNIVPRRAVTRPIMSLGSFLLEAAKRIYNTMDGRRQFPKERVFQQLFHDAMSSGLPAHHTVLPEMNTSVVVNRKKVLGELDFYIHTLQWAL
jgi:hypothetical protein